MEKISIDKYMKSFDVNNPMHLIVVGAILIGVVLLKTALLMMAIAIFAVAIYFIYSKRKNEQ